ncbi:MAG: hypothetical protein JSW00_15450 [Thermoplasmata archaeon]|nr:MAG: hypothetical protein JSW00_15450 [Thermoplasmata archaeon]
MEKKSISIWLALLLVGTIYTIMFTGSVSAVNNDHNLSGLVWQSDGSLPTQKTEFCVWVQYPPVTGEWYRFPEIGWAMTDDDDPITVYYYSFVLPNNYFNDRWGDGSAYTIHVNGDPWGELDGNITSNGTGSVGDPYPTPYDPGNPANTYNTINYAAGGGYGNEQQWDVRTVAPIDLAPTDVMVNDAPPDPTGNPVGPGDTVTINFTVTNFGIVGTGITFNASIWECDSGGDPYDPLNPDAHFTLLGPLNEFGNTSGDGYVTIVLTFYWDAPTGPTAPGDYYFNITVDSGYKIFESDETNNTFILFFKIGPDLIPTNVLVDGSPPPPVDPIYIDPGQVVQIMANASNVGNSQTGGPFDISLYRITGPGGDKIPGDPVYGYTVGNLLEGQTSSSFTWDWTAPDTAGYYWVNITVDYQGVIPEGNEYNNSFTIYFAVVPDLVPYNVTINYEPVKDPVVLAPLETIIIGAYASNNGSSGTGTFQFAISFQNCSEDGSPIAGPFNISSDVGPLISGGFSVDVYALWQMPEPDSGTDFYVKIKVDIYGTVSEIDEDNNEYIIHFRLDAPDLTPDRIEVRLGSDVMFQSDNPYGDGFNSTQIDIPVVGTIYIVFDVKNVGGVNMSIGTNATFYNISAEGAPANATPFYQTAPDAINLKGLGYFGDQTSEVGQTVIAEWPNPGFGGVGIIWYINLTVDYNGSINYKGRIKELNDETNNTYTLKINLTPKPVTYLKVGDPQYVHTAGKKWYITSSTELNLTSWGLYEPYYQWYRILWTNNRTEAKTWTNYTEDGGKNFTIDYGEDTYTIEFYTIDGQNTTGDTYDALVVVDDTPPTTSIFIDEPKYRRPSSSDIFNITNATEISLTAYDNPTGNNSEGMTNASGVANSYYRVRNATSWLYPWQEYSGPFKISGEDGDYWIHYNSTDNLGWQENENITQIYLDNTGPTTTITVGLPSLNATIFDYVKSTTQFTLDAFENVGSGVNASSIQYKVSLHDDSDSTGWIKGTTFDIASVLPRGDDFYYIQFMAYDNLNNDGDIGRIDVYVDDTGPNAPLQFFTPKYRVNDTHRWNITDDTDMMIYPYRGAGVPIDRTLYRIYDAIFDSGQITFLSIPFNLSVFSLNDGVYTIEWISYDVFDNWNMFNDTLYLDNTPPTTVISDPPIGPHYRAQDTDLWNITNESEFNLTADDGEGCGVNITHYRIYNSTDSSGWMLYQGNFNFSSLSLNDGIYTIQYESIDYLWNRRDYETDVNLDNSRPTTVIEWEHTSEDWNVEHDAWEVELTTTFNLTADDGDGSGIREIWYQIDSNGWTLYNETFLITTTGSHMIYYYSVDNLGLDGPIGSTEYYIEGDVAPPLPPVLTLRVSGDDIVLEWVPSPDEQSQDIHHYLIYRSTTKTGFDFSSPWVDTSGFLVNGVDPIDGKTIPLRTTWNDTGAVIGAPEYYYTIRGVDDRNNTGYPSNIVGKVTMTFDKGYNTFSLPLEPFETITASEMLEHEVFGESDTIYRYDSGSQKWKGRPKFLPSFMDNFQLVMGDGYMLYIVENNVQYTFVGSTATAIRYAPGAGSELVFRDSLIVEIQGSDVALKWDTSPNATGYNIYRAEVRMGNGSLTDYSIEPIAEGLPQDATSWTDTEATGYEYYYLVVALDDMGEQGSTYAVGFRTYEFKEGYNLFSFELNPRPASTVSMFTTNWFSSDSNMFYYYDRMAGYWVGHPRILPDHINNADVSVGSAYIVYIPDEDANLSQSGI